MREDPATMWTLALTVHSLLAAALLLASYFQSAMATEEDVTPRISFRHSKSIPVTLLSGICKHRSKHDIQIWWQFQKNNQWPQHSVVYVAINCTIVITFHWLVFKMKQPEKESHPWNVVFTLNFSREIRCSICNFSGRLELRSLLLSVSLWIQGSII